MFRSLEFLKRPSAAYWPGFTSRAPLILIAFSVALAIVTLGPGLLIDFSPGVAEKWLALAAALGTVVLIALVLKGLQRALCLMLPSLLGLNFTLFAVGIRKNDFLTSNQIGYRPWVQIFDVFIVLALALAMKNLLQRRRARGTAEVGWLPFATFAVFLLVCGLSLAAAESVRYGMIGLFALGRFLLWYTAFFLMFAKSPRLASTMTWGFAGFVFIQASIGIFQAAGIPTVERLPGLSTEHFTYPSQAIRVGGTLGRANLESVLLLIVPVLFAYSFERRERARFRRLILIAAILGLMLVFLTGSRGPMIATLIGVAIALGVLRLGHLTRGQLVKLSLLAFLFIVGLAVLLSLSGIASTLLRDTYSYRLESFLVASRMATANPVTGVGLNNYLRAGSAYGMSATEILFGRPVHNQFLLVAAETGLIGLLMFALCLGSWWWVTRRAAAICRLQSAPCWLPNGVRGALAAFLVTSLFDSPLIKSPVMPPLAILIAAASAAAVRRETAPSGQG